MLSRKVKLLEKEPEICDDGLHHLRTSVAVLFAGRTRELNTLLYVPYTWGGCGYYAIWRSGGDWIDGCIRG